MTNGPVFESGSPRFEGGPGWGSRLGEWFKSNLVYIVPAIAVLALILVFANKSGENMDFQSILLGESPSQTPEIPIDSISEIVLRGDSYTTVARRAITSHSKIDMESGILVYAETVIAKKITDQPLAAGATIMIPSELIDETLASFSSLSEYQRAQWRQYQRRLPR